ncbi:hypothetical protein QUB56_33695 [Microcoleus sp. AR_TQ3_B6]
MKIGITQNLVNFFYLLYIISQLGILGKAIALIFPKCDRPYLPKVRSP